MVYIALCNKWSGMAGSFPALCSWEKQGKATGEPRWGGRFLGSPHQNGRKFEIESLSYTGMVTGVTWDQYKTKKHKDRSRKRFTPFSCTKAFNYSPKWRGIKLTIPFWVGTLSARKTLFIEENVVMCKLYKPLTMRPNRFMSRCILSFDIFEYKTVLCLSCYRWKLYVAMETVQANLKVTNKAQFERFTVQILPKLSTLYEFEVKSALAGLHRFDCQVQQCSFLNMQIIIYIRLINLLFLFAVFTWQGFFQLNVY